MEWLIPGATIYFQVVLDALVNSRGNHIFSGVLDAVVNSRGNRIFSGGP